MLQLNTKMLFQFGPLTIKIFGYASGLGLIIWWSLKKSGLSLGLGLGLTGLEKLGSLGLVT